MSMSLLSSSPSASSSFEQRLIKKHLKPLTLSPRNVRLILVLVRCALAAGTIVFLLASFSAWRNGPKQLQRGALGFRYGRFREEEISFLWANVPENVERMKAMPPRVTASGRKSILVSIASFKDRRCSETIADLLSKCRHCDRVFIAVADQRGPGDPICQVPKQFEKQVLLLEFDVAKATGPCLGRYLASQLYQGEDYFMQIDAHSLMLQDWDVIAMDWMLRVPSPRSVISAYPAGDLKEFEPSDPRFDAIPFICRAVYEPGLKGLFHHGADPFRIREHGGIVQATPFIGAGFWFAPAQVLMEVPFDRYLDWVFNGEEFLLAIRMWTSGWELVAPERNIVFHYYGDTEKRASVFERSHDPEPALKRVRYITGVSDEFPNEAAAELEHLGLGKERSKAQYEEYSGLDLRAHKQPVDHCKDVYDWNARRWLPPGASQQRKAPLTRPLTPRNALLHDL